MYTLYGTHVYHLHHSIIHKYSFILVHKIAIILLLLQKQQIRMNIIMNNAMTARKKKPNKVLHNVANNSSIATS